MDTARIPTVRFGDFAAGGQARERFIKGLGLGLEWFGFVFVLDHGIDDALLVRARVLAENFFSLPEATKRTYETPDDGRQRGYTPFGVEHAKDREVADLKEFWHVGRKLSADHPSVASGDIPPTPRAGEAPGFDEAAHAAFAAMDRFAAGLLSAIELHLGRPEGTFDALTHEGGSVLRITHYPPLPDIVPAGAVRDAEHEDVNLLTLMPAAAELDLQLRSREGEWMAVSPPPGALICSTGDMMQLLTDGKLRATPYRVLNPPPPHTGSRISLAFYCHPRPDGVLQPARDGTLAVTAQAFLMKRLRDIGLA